MINLFFYSVDTLKLVCVEKGLPEFTLRDAPEDCDFTLTPPPDSDHDWRWVDTEWVADPKPERPIAEVRDEVWTRIKDTRAQQVTGGVLVKSVGKVFHTDEMSAIQYSHVAGAIALDNYTPIMWKVKDNTWVELTPELFKELQTAMQANTQKNYEAAEKHLHALNLTENPAEYDYSAGWTNGVVDY